MAYVPGEYYITCAGCVKNIFRSEAVRGNYNKLLYCRKCVDYKWPKPQKLPNDPRPISGKFINIEPEETFIPTFSDGGNNWEDIEWVWESISTNWEDL